MSKLRIEILDQELIDQTIHSEYRPEQLDPELDEELLSAIRSQEKVL